MARVTAERAVDTRIQLLEAARQVLLEHGFSGLSTRRVAQLADAPMSQIQYHFGSKDGMVIALFEYMNAALLDRQRAMFGDPTLKVSQQWELACDFLEDDLNSGYVQILQELIAAGWSNPTIRATVVDGLDGWHRVLMAAARRAERQVGHLAPFSPGEVAALVSVVFLGAEAQILLGRENPRVPHRRALRRIGEVIRHFEDVPEQGEE